MARVQTVNKARASKRQRKCTLCGHEVQAGESYKYIDKKTGPRSGFTLFFCSQHNPRGSHLASGRESEILGMCEGFEDELGGVNDSEALASAIASFREDLEMFAEEVREAAQSIEEHFDYTPQSEAMGETADAIEEWAGEFEDLEDQCGEEDQQDEDEDWDEQAHFDELQAEAGDLLSNMPELNFTG